MYMQRYTQANSNDNMVTQIIKPFGSTLNTRQGHKDQAHLSALLLIMLLASWVLFPVPDQLTPGEIDAEIMCQTQITLAEL